MAPRPPAVSIGAMGADDVDAVVALMRSVRKRAGFRRIATRTNHWFGQDYYLWEWYPG